MMLMLSFLSGNGIVTIRHLVESWDKEIKTLVPENALFPLLNEAKMAANIYIAAQNLKKYRERGLAVWVYHYASDVVYEQIKEEKALKSAYVMFNEYLHCDASLRHLHSWQRVQHAYARDAAKWMGKKDTDINKLTAADIFSFLVWRASSSYGKYDCTAGPKAIYFSWVPMPELLRMDTIAIDAVTAEDLHDPYLADRFSKVIYINLTKLVQEYGARLHRVEASAINPKKVDSNNWIPTTLEQANELTKDNENLVWQHFEAGETFQNVPHGCVVLNKGFIPADCLRLE